jgi:hypothetical protein
MKIIFYQRATVLILISLIIAVTNTIYCQTNRVDQPLPSKAKLKFIEFGSFRNRLAPHYVAIGFVNKKQFVENQKITFMSVTNPASRVDAYELKDTLISGKYYCSKDGNSYIDGFWEVENPDIDIVIKGIFRISNKENGIGITANKKEGRSFSVNIEKTLYYKAFDSEKEEIIILQRVPKDTFSLKIKYRDLTLETLLPKATEGIAIEMKKDGTISNIPDIIISQQVILTYGNGDVFNGSVKYVSDNNFSHEPSYKPKEGEYRYANGEIFIGKWGERNSWQREKIPIDGQMQFTDGSIENGNWLQKYNVREETLSNANTLTEKHNLAIRLYEAERQKLQEEKIAKQQAVERKRQAEERKKIAEQRLYNTLTNKYGNYWGELIYNREFTPGMTKKMVLEFTSQKIYKISKAIRNGNYIEIWELDPQKLAWETIKEEGEKGAMTLLALSLIENLGMGNINSQFPTLVFTNDKLTDVYQK